MTKKTGKSRGKPQGKKPEGTSLPGTPPPGTDIPAPVSPPAVPMPVQAEIALQQRQRAQKWTHLPRTGKVQKTVGAILALKVQGFSTAEIAEQLGIKAASVRQYLWIAGKNNWLTTHDPHEVAHSQLVHRAVSNLDEWLHARDGRTGLPDKEITLESLKGLGVFGGASPAQQNDQGHTNVLAIQITMPVSGTAGLPQVRQGNAGGAPAYIDGQVLDGPASRRQLSE